MKLSKIKSENGSTMPIVLVFIVVAVILVFALFTLSDNSLSLTNYKDKSERAYYIARSGAEIALAYLEENEISSDLEFNRIYLTSDNDYTTNAISDYKGYCDVFITLGAYNNYFIKSIGNCEDKIRTVNLTFSGGNSGYNTVTNCYFANRNEIKRGNKNGDDVIINGNAINSRYYNYDGSIDIFKVDDVDAVFTMKEYGNSSKRAYGVKADTVIVHNKLLLYDENDNKLAFCIISKDICFNNDITLYNSNIEDEFHTLVLGVDDKSYSAEELKIKNSFKDLVDDDAKYGLVFFDTVNIIDDEGQQNISTKISDKGFYFKKIAGMLALTNSSYESFADYIDYLINNGYLIPANIEEPTFSGESKVTWDD